MKLKRWPEMTHPQRRAENAIVCMIDRQIPLDGNGEDELMESFMTALLSGMDEDEVT